MVFAEAIVVVVVAAAAAAAAAAVDVVVVVVVVVVIIICQEKINKIFTLALRENKERGSGDVLFLFN